jgi:DNA-binding NtrC family response regulator
LNVVPVTLPPLRERPEDIPPLIEHFLAAVATRLKRPPLTLSRDAYRALVECEWKGNVRELEHAIEQAVALASGPEIEIGDLPTLVPRAASEEAAPGVETDPTSTNFREAKQQVVERFERRFIIEALERSQGNISKAAEDLGMYRQHLQTKLAEYGIDAASYKKR